MKRQAPERSDSGVRSHPVASVLAAGFLCGAIALTLYLMNPPAAVGADAPAAEFSSARALEHLRVIAQRPHPVGSAEHRAVFDYIVREVSRLHGPPDVQTATAGNESAGAGAAPPLQNIAVRLQGSEPGGRALMLAAHYDSVPGSPGASDDGSGVVTLLETLRALKAGPPLKNDVICLFTDGEELGLLGARAFVAEHPWAKDVGLALNFEARGSGGPVFMFETSRPNGVLVKEFSRAAPRPFTNSLMGEVYKLLGNDTDFTVFKRAGLAGLNFAYVGEAANYHSPRDDVSRIDERSVQHHGTYALALTRHFGNLDLRNMEAPDVVYFDVLGLKVFSYPQTWNRPLTVILLLLAAGVAALGLRAGRLSLAGVVRGAFLFILGVACALVVTTLLWDQVRTLPQVSAAGRNVVYFLWSLAALTVSLISATYILAGRRTRGDEQSVGALLALVPLAAAVNLALPGGGFLLTWPLIFSLFASAASFILKEPRASSLPYLVLLAVCALPGVVLFTQMLHNLSQGIGLSAPYVQVGLVGVLVGLLTPFIKFAYVPRRWAPPIFFFVVGLICFGVGLSAS
jgi:hypothetical protein